MRTCDLQGPAVAGGVLSPWAYRTSNSYTVMLAGGRVILRGASVNELSATVTGGPLNGPHPGPAGAGGAVGGRRQLIHPRGPAGLDARQLSSHSCGVLGGIDDRDGHLSCGRRCSAAKTSSGYVGLPEGRAELSIPTVPLVGRCGELPLTATRQRAREVVVQHLHHLAFHAQPDGVAVGVARHRAHASGRHGEADLVRVTEELVVDEGVGQGIQHRVVGRAQARSPTRPVPAETTRRTRTGCPCPSGTGIRFTYSSHASNLNCTRFDSRRTLSSRARRTGRTAPWPGRSPGWGSRRSARRGSRCGRPTSCSSAPVQSWREPKANGSGSLTFSRPSNVLNCRFSM